MFRPQLASSFALSILYLCAVSLSSARAQERPVAFVGATVVPVSGQPIPNGTVIVQNGKIKSVGAGIAIPSDAWRIDARGKTIIPGLIDAQSSLFLAPE